MFEFCIINSYACGVEVLWCYLTKVPVLFDW